jgi:hypothetical protein
MTWTDILLKIADGNENIASPYDKEGKIEYRYVVFDEKARIGYLWAWCNKTFNGIKISRVKVPLNAKYITAEEFKTENIPPIINWVDPEKKIIQNR